MIHDSIIHFVIVFIGGMVFYAFYVSKYFRNKSPVHQLEPEKEAIIDGDSAEDLTCKKLGDRFEEYLVKEIYERGNSKWRLMEWRSDKYIEEINYFPESSLKPDLEYRNGSIRIAFECKWRQYWSKTGKGKQKVQIVESAKKWKMQKYREYRTKEDVTTYLAIGVGWDDTANKPCKLYFIDLDDIWLTFNDLQKNFKASWK